MKRSLIRAILLAIAPTLLLLLVSVSGETQAVGWKIFSNRSGWSIHYPANWSTGSCHSCPDPKKAGVYVDFFPPKHQASDGWVMVSPLADYPKDTSLDDWFSRIDTTANLNPIIRKQRLTLNGAPAAKVRYRNPSLGEMEETYIVSGSHTFAISFSVDRDIQSLHLEDLGNYPAYLKMLDTFKDIPKQ